MPEMRSAVVAGSKGFVDAVEGHIKMRLGAAPRVARDPGEALRACAETGGLLVLEYAGTPWLDAVKNLRSACGDAVLSIVAAVPAAEASDVEPLQRAGVDEVVSWQGRVDPVLWAVDRIVGRQGAQESEAALPGPERTNRDAVENGLQLGGSGGAAAAVSLPPPPSLTRGATSATSAQVALLWPNGVPSAAAAEALLLSVFAGQGGDDPVHVAAAERALATAAELERAALAGTETALAPVLLRSAAALRLRLDLALSSVPVRADAMDQQAAQQLLAEVDGVLEQVKALGVSAPVGLAPALEPVRLAIVDGGVKLAGALTQLVPQGAQDAAVPKREQKPGTRLLSNVSAADAKASAPVRKGMWIALLATALGVGGYHAWQQANRPRPIAPATAPGGPANTTLLNKGRVRLLTVTPGKKVDPAELDRFRALEEAKGNIVRNISQGSWVIEPSGPREGAKP